MDTLGEQERELNTMNPKQGAAAPVTYLCDFDRALVRFFDSSPLFQPHRQDLELELRWYARMMGETRIRRLLVEVQQRFIHTGLADYDEVSPALRYIRGHCREVIEAEAAR